MPPECVSFLCEGIKKINGAQAEGSGQANGETCPLEWTVEMNPADVTEKLLKAWNDGGANRLSLGLQSFSGKALKAIGRRGDAKQNIAALGLAASMWRGELSVDLIAGLPFQSETSLQSDISAALSFNPSHVSLYQLTLEEGAPLFALNSRGAISLPDEDEAASIWNAGKKMLVEAGLYRYEVSNFALKGQESRHNMAYWQLNSFIGAGPGASGTFVSGGNCVRIENTKSIEEWLAFWGDEENAASFDINAFAQDAAAFKGAPAHIEKVSYTDFAFETLMMGMRLTKGISEADFSARFAEGLDGLFGRTIKKWLEAGRLKREGGRMALTEAGLLFLNAFLLECLDELYSKKSSLKNEASLP